MAESNYFAHTSPSGETMADRYERKCSGDDPVHLVAKKGNEFVGYAVCHDKSGDG